MDELDVMLFKTWLTRHRNQLASNRNAEYQAEDEDGVESDDDETSADGNILDGEESSDSSEDE